MLSKEIYQNFKSHEILNMCRKLFHRQKVKFVVKFRILNLHILLIKYFPNILKDGVVELKTSKYIIENGGPLLFTHNWRNSTNYDNWELLWNMSWEFSFFLLIMTFIKYMGFHRHYMIEMAECVVYLSYTGFSKCPEELF